ncbi:MAG: Ig-like domain-containing protein, partial [Bdellovibrio sp.]
PLAPTIPLGQTQQLTATATLTDGTPANVTSTVAWNSNDTTVATVNTTGLISSANLGTALVSGTVGSQTVQIPVTVTPAQLVSIQIAPSSGSVALGLTQQFTATGTYSDSTQKDLTNSVTWTSSAPSYATINSSGLLTSVAPGSFTVTANSSGVSRQVWFTVAPAALASLEITPSAPGLTQGATQQFTATGRYTDGTSSDLTNTVTWNSSNSSLVSITSQGLATAVAVGSATISASSQSVTTNTPVTVGAVQLSSIQISPLNASVPLGYTQQFIAVGTYTDGSSSNITSSVTWASSNMAAATISNTAGSKGLLTSQATGATTVSATLGAVSANTPFTVSAASLLSINLQTSGGSLAKGLTTQYTALGTYSNGAIVDISNLVNWSVSNPLLASISNTGLLQTLGVGNVQVTANLGAVSSQSSLGITNPALVSVTVTPAIVSLLQGLGRQMTATGTYTDGSTLNITNVVTWSVSGNLLCGINATGYLSCVALTSGTVTATLGTTSGQAAIVGL